MKKEYAKVIHSSLMHGTSSEELVKNLLAHLKRTGRMKLLPHILREYKILASKEEYTTPNVEVAHQKESAHALQEAKKLGITAAHTRVNHALIRGWRARAGSRLIDRSAKRMLIDIYQNVVAGT